MDRETAADREVFSRKFNGNLHAYSIDFPLGPPGYLYNSMDKLVRIESMPAFSVQRAIDWLSDTFLTKAFACEKLCELEKELERRSNGN